MARFSQILTPAGDAVIKLSAITAASTATTVQPGAHRIIAINATDDINVAFGGSSVSASSSSYRIPAGQQTTFDTGSNSYLSVYNLGTGTTDVYIMLLEGR